MDRAYRDRLSHPLLQERELKVLQKDGFFRNRRDESFRQNQPIAPAPVAASTPAPSEPEKKIDERKESKLVVGPDIKLKGVEISDCDTLVVEGRVEATLDSRILEISENGVFQGTIAVDQAEIRGRFEGEITVRKQLVIHGTGKVSGKIRYAKIKVEEGAELSGDLAVMDKSTASFSATKRVANA
jgi:cytoskeletal protein CcmA (bactofilin family)